MKALLVVDMQNDFSESGTLPVPGFSEIIKPINSKISSYHLKKNLIIFTQDWHPKGHMSFKEWGEHCVIDSPGAELHKDLKVPKSAYILRKGEKLGVDSYSIFKDNYGNWLKEVATILKQKNVTDIEIVGVSGDYCVKSTAFDAVILGFNVTVNKTLVRYINEDNIDSIDIDYSNKGIKVI